MLDPKLFAKPPMEYSGVPFWSINDKLDPEEVGRQIDRMVDAGFGGAFFHAREGLVTPFLGDEWFKTFRVAVEAAKRRGAYMWIYDELRWPSGFAGGLVPALRPEMAAKALVAVASDRAFSGERVVAAFRVHLDERGVPAGYERAETSEVGRASLYLTFVEYVAQPGETWYEGFCYVDLLDPEAVKLFIEAAYEPYVRFKEEFGRTIPGVFTDEPNIESSRPHLRVQLPPRGPRFPAVSLPWTGKLPVRFRELNGYDVVEKLPELIFEVGDYLKTRHDYWRTVTQLFVEAFSEQIYEWCEKHGLKFTGHYLAEDSLLSQLRCTGAVMPHYEYQHVPGIDHLGFQIWGSLLTAKQVASVANQLGRRRVLCETYGCTGNYPSFADRKWIGDFLYALGVNFLNHHLLPYSLRGRRKRDYGLNFHWAQPWWRYNRLIEDYFARLSYALSQGVRLANVLVVHPIGSAWALYTPIAERKVAELDERFGRLLRELLSLHIDFELGDEILMAKHAIVEGRRLRVGRAVYDAVIMPPSVTIASTTFKLLSEFARAGGTIIFVEPPPERIDGKPSGEQRELVSCGKLVPPERGALEEALKGVPKPVLIEGDPEGFVLYHLRKIDGDLLLFLANTERTASRTLRVGVEGSWKPELWDAITGGVRDLGGKLEGGRTWLDLELPPVGSALVRFTQGAPSPPTPLKLKSSLEVPLGESGWELRRLDPNALVLDYCRFRTEEGSWSDMEPVWRAQREIVRKGLGTSFTLKFGFELLADPLRVNPKLVVEVPHLYEVKVNGKPVEVWKPSWFDPSFGTADVSHLLVEGFNEVEVSGRVGVEPELEPVCVFGDFGVEVRPRGSSRIIEERKLVNASNLCVEGLPFYAGSVELIKRFELLRSAKRVTLRFSELNAALAEVYVNGEKAGVIFLPPYEIDVTRCVKPGVNEVKIVLVGTLRNLLGPLHYKGGDPAWTGPETFTDEAHWTDEYVLKPFGFKDPRIVLYD